MMLERVRGIYLAGLFLCSAFISLVPCSASSTTPLTNQRRLGFAYYDMPPFAMSFESPNRLEGDQDVDGTLLASTLGLPLKLVVAEFLLDSFQLQLAGAGEDPELPEMIRQFVNLDLKVTVVARNVGQESRQGSVRRQLQQGEDYIEFYAQFVGRAHFVEPLDPNTEPSDHFMWSFLGQWIEASLQERVLLKQRLQDSDEPILQNMRALAIMTNVKEGDFPYGTSSSSGRSAADKGLIAALVVIGVATFVLAVSFMRPYVVRKLSPMDGAFPSPDDPHTVLPGRKDAIDVMSRSDRWMQEKRPDLFDLVQKTTSPRSMGGDGDPDMIMKTSPSTQSSHSSKPLQFLFGGMFLTHKKRNRSDENIPSLASQDENAAVDDIDSSQPVNGWWNKLAASLNNGIHHRDGHGLVCDENPRDYSFAFRDFPRHDGTPCLIYTETDGGLTQREATYSESSSPTTPTSRGMSLNDDEFRRQLSMQSFTSSLEDEEPAQDELVEMDFTEKLERLVAMRRRHYEKEMIIEKGREARRKDREETEARERQLKLRRHEMELDLKEIEDALTPRSLSRKTLVTQDDSSCGRRKSHRLASSDSEFFSTESKENTAVQNDSRALAEAKRRIKENRSGGTSTGPSTRHEDDSSTSGMPPKRPASRSPSVSSASSWEYPVHDPHPHAIQPRKSRHRKSHRRSFSHGTKQRTQSFEEKKEGDSSGQAHKRHGSNADDVMTFGIAAYTQFV